MPEPVPQPTPTREPRGLTTEYHKARKQLMLWSAILLIWELVGVDLDKAKDAGGNVGAIIGAIRSRQAVPWTLVILVGYFLFRFTVEWNQSNTSRRLMRWAKIDFTAGWIVSLAAFALYIGQTLSRVQFADILQDRTKALSLAIGSVSSVSLVFGIIGLWRSNIFSKARVLWPDRYARSFLSLSEGRRRRVALANITIGSAIFLGSLLIGPTRFHLHWAFLLTGFCGGAIVAGVPLLALSRPWRLMSALAEHAQEWAESRERLTRDRK